MIVFLIMQYLLTPTGGVRNYHKLHDTDSSVDSVPYTCIHVVTGSDSLVKSSGSFSIISYIISVSLCCHQFSIPARLDEMTNFLPKETHQHGFY